MPSYCSPYAKDKNIKKSDLSCFSYNSLKKIANTINLNNKNNLINISKNKTKLWIDLKKLFGKVCKDEWCWHNISYIKKLNDQQINDSHVP